MTPAQTKLYWREWSRAKKAGQLGDADRHLLHAQALGAEKSSKDFTNEDLDKVLASFRALSQPSSLNAQLRQQEQPNTRRLHKIANLLKCLGLFVAEPVQYASAILRDRFHVSVLEDLARVDLNAELVGDKYSPRPLGGEGQGEGVHSELEKLIYTLSRCVSVLRRKGDFASGGHFPDLTEHEMCRLAKVPCFRSNCAECRDERSSRREEAPINISRELEPAHTHTEEEPF
jgi:hypothetical protein